jgi:hypothetical protein
MVKSKLQHTKINERKMTKEWTGGKITKVVQTTKTFEEYRIEVEECLQDIGQSIKHIGEMLIRSGKELLGDDVTRFRQFLLNRGLTESDLKVAVLVAEEKLDARLFFMGVASSKILNLSHEDQLRLLSHEKFALRHKNKKDTYFKEWGEMCAGQKNQLLGPKGGRILPPDEQKPWDRDKPQGKVTISCSHYSDRTLVFDVGQKIAYCQLVDIMTTLRANHELEAFINDILTLRSEWASKVA